MGRRALRKIDPELDYSACFRDEEQLPEPLDLAALFGREAPVEVELGTGKGLFLEAACQARPDHNFLGLEIARKYAHYAAARLARQESDNGIVVHGDGLRVFRECLTDGSLAAIHVYFPDPWWKKRHRRRRVMRPEFLADVHRTLAPGGVLHFWTDVHEYYEATLELLNESELAGPREVSVHTAEHDLDYRTHFERRTRLAGEPVYRCQFVKEAT